MEGGYFDIALNPQLIDGEVSVRASFRKPVCSLSTIGSGSLQSLLPIAYGGICCSSNCSAVAPEVQLNSVSPLTSLIRKGYAALMTIS